MKSVNMHGEKIKVKYRLFTKQLRPNDLHNGHGLCSLSGTT